MCVSDTAILIRITNKRKIIRADYSIHGHVLGTTDQAKYLGVTIDSKITWGPHISNITRKANNTLAFLRRNISSCPRNIKETSYKTLVRPQTEYASSVWDHSTKTLITTLEAVQRRAARFITGNNRRESSITSMLQDIHLESLESTRLRKARCTMMYRVVNHLIDIPSSSLQPVRAGTRGHSQRFQQPSCTIRCYQDSFFPASIVLWNSLPPTLVSADSLDVFKTRISTTSI